MTMQSLALPISNKSFTRKTRSQSQLPGQNSCLSTQTRRPLHHRVTRSAGVGKEVVACSRGGSRNLADERRGSIRGLGRRNVSFPWKHHGSEHWHRTEESMRRRSPRLRAQESQQEQPAGGSQEQMLLFRVRGDGNCLFRALSQGSYLQITGGGVRKAMPPSEETREAAKLRSLIAQELRKRRSDVEPFIDQDYVRYVDKMERDGTWGGEPELAMAGHVLQMPVRVFALAGDQVTLVNEYGAEYFKVSRGRAISVFFHGMGHYDLLASP